MEFTAFVFDSPHSVLYLKQLVPLLHHLVNMRGSILKLNSIWIYIISHLFDMRTSLNQVGAA
jgi:hypothetical protein